MPLHFLFVLGLIVAVIYFTQSWAAVLLIGFCLAIYYGRQYLLLVRRPHQAVKKAQEAQSASLEESNDSAIPPSEK